MNVKLSNNISLNQFDVCLHDMGLRVQKDAIFFCVPFVTHSFASVTKYEHEKIPLVEVFCFCLLAYFV